MCENIRGVSGRVQEAKGCYQVIEGPITRLAEIFSRSISDDVSGVNNLNVFNHSVL